MLKKKRQKRRIRTLINRVCKESLYIRKYRWAFRKWKVYKLQPIRFINDEREINPLEIQKAFERAMESLNK